MYYKCPPLFLSLSNTYTLTHRNTTLIFITPVLFHFIFFRSPLLGYLSTNPKQTPHVHCI